MLPNGFPPFLTVYRWPARFRGDGTWERINDHLVMQEREQVGRGTAPSAAILDSQSANIATLNLAQIFSASEFTAAEIAETAKDAGVLTSDAALFSLSVVSDGAIAKADV